METAKQFLEKKQFVVYAKPLSEAMAIPVHELRSWFFCRQSVIEEQAREIVKISGLNVFNSKHIGKQITDLQAQAWREFLEAIK